MNFLHFQKKIRLFLLLAIIPIFILSYAYIVIPKNLTLFEGENFEYQNILPFTNVYVNDTKIISVEKATDKKNSYWTVFSPFSFKSFKIGEETINIRLFDTIPIKTIKVEVIPKLDVIPDGRSIGVKMLTDGVLVVGFSDISTTSGKKENPAKMCGIKEGDIIVAANRQKVKDTENLSDIIESSEGRKINLQITRKGETINYELNPAISIDDKKPKIGAYVRDSTAGIGTLTFTIPGKQCFAALGHGITDIDTGDIMKLSSGCITLSTIIDISKGERGKPGELKGIFGSGDDIGIIKDNNEFGIFGQLTGNGRSLNQPIEIAFRSQVSEGPAYILSNIEGEKVEKFNVDIVKVMKQAEEGPKGMIIKVTDKTLLNKTGGIVQGMSGSPIIQDNRLVGAVTHVFVNDPTRGYGTFIEWMVAKALKSVKK